MATLIVLGVQPGIALQDVNKLSCSEAYVTKQCILEAQCSSLTQPTTLACPKCYWICQCQNILVSEIFVCKTVFKTSLNIVTAQLLCLGRFYRFIKRDSNHFSF